MSISRPEVPRRYGKSAATAPRWPQQDVHWRFSSRDGCLQTYTTRDVAAYHFCCGFLRRSSISAMLSTRELRYSNEKSNPTEDGTAKRFESRVVFGCTATAAFQQMDDHARCVHHDYDVPQSRGGLGAAAWPHLGLVRRVQRKLFGR